MSFRPYEILSPKQVETGLHHVTRDGLAAETMTTLTSGTFLVVIALYFGASNFQIGLLAALPTFTNVFQLLSIHLVQQFNNRKAIAVIANFFARLPLLVIGLLPFVFSKETSLQTLIALLFIHYLCGSVAGASWNSWMKDLIPERQLGRYFSHRSQLTQIFNVVLSLILAVAIDYIKERAPQQEVFAYSYMFILGGLIGLTGVYFLYATPEPKSFLPKENLAKLFLRPLQTRNFRKLLVFNSFWLFAVNLATPFFTVYMMQALHLSVSYVITFTILSQVSSIGFVRLWGTYADRYSNKTIIVACAPLFTTCLIGWSFVSKLNGHWLIIALSVLHIGTGLSNSGINLALMNIGLKLAPSKNSIVYLAVKNIITSAFAAVAPLVGGLLADFFTAHSLEWTVMWKGPQATRYFYLLELRQWNFFFMIGALLAIVSLQFLKRVKEMGEIDKDILITDLKNAFKVKFRRTYERQAIRERFYHYTNLFFVSNKISTGIHKLLKYQSPEEPPDTAKENPATSSPKGA